MKKVLSICFFGLLVSLFFIGCEQLNGGPEGELAARVNSKGVSIAQLDYELFLAKRGNPNLNAEEAKPAAIEQLINQELLAQKSVEAGYNQNPAVKIAIQRAEKRLLAQAYLEKIYGTMPVPSEDDIKNYFNTNPALFAQRRIYKLQQYAFGAAVDMAQLEQRVKQAKNAQSFYESLSKDKVVANARALSAPAEKLPMALLTALQEIPDGKGAVRQGNNGPVVIWRVGSEFKPATFENTKESIRGFLIKKAREDRVRQEIASLRGSATLEYVGTNKPVTVVDMKQPLPELDKPESEGVGDMTEGKL